MVQLPATAAIEYVAACRTRTRTRPKTRTKTKTVRGAYARSPKFNAYTNRLGFLCLASYSVTDKKNKQTDKLGLLAPRGVDPRSPNFQGM